MGDVVVLAAIPSQLSNIRSSPDSLHPASSSFEIQFGPLLPVLPFSISEQYLFRPLSREDSNLIQSVYESSDDPDTLVARIGTDTVQLGSFLRLRDDKWLNDEIVNSYMTLLLLRDKEQCARIGCRRSHFFKSFFVTKYFRLGYSGVKRWSRAVHGGDIFALDKIIFPINLGGLHWVCVVAFMQKKVIEYHDSLASKKVNSQAEKYMKGILFYFEMEHRRLKKRLMVNDHWTLVNRVDTPKQDNGNDCGIFTCLTAHFRSLDLQQNYSSNDMPACRRQMGISILKVSQISYSPSLSIF